MKEVKTTLGEIEFSMFHPENDDKEYYIDGVNKIVAIHGKDESTKHYFEGQPEAFRLLTVHFKRPGYVSPIQKKMKASTKDEVIIRG